MPTSWGGGSWGSGGWGGSGSVFVPPTPIILPGTGWGQEHFGTDEYGSATALVSITIKAAVAISTHQVKVTLSAAAQAIVSTLTGDALNPATWTVQRLDNAHFLTVVAVQELTPEVFILTTFEKFGPSTVTHRVSSTTLLDVNGSPAQQPNQADFLGVRDADDQNNQRRLAARRAVQVDIANPQVPGLSTATYGGTLRVTSGGDYESESGRPLLRKLIYRRLVTDVGEFFHLPDYGLGLPLKQIITTADLVKLKARAENQALHEPEAQSATASVTLTSSGILTVVVNVIERTTGDPVSVTVEVPTQEVVL